MHKYIQCNREYIPTVSVIALFIFATLHMDMTLRVMQFYFI